MAKYDVAKYNLIYIYAINDGQHDGLLKIGEASFSAVESIAQLIPNCARLNTAAANRIDQQTKTALVKYDLLYTELAVRTITMQDGSKQVQQFSDHDVHDVLLASGVKAQKFVESGKPSEWYMVDLTTAKKAIQCVKDGISRIPSSTTVVAPVPTLPVIKLRKEQDENVRYTMDIFKRYDTMLWDCKMRYGKTVTAYELIKRQGYKKVIVITHRPAVADSWSSDHKLMFNGTPNEFIDKTNSAQVFDEAMDADNDRNLKEKVASDTPFVYFTSIQDLRLSKRVGGPYNKNNAVFDMDWELLIVDEAHEGTSTELGEAVIKLLKKSNTKLLSLSGTPYNIMGEFEENKYTWTYVDEQKAKEAWDVEHPNERNPYEELPKMNIFTFDLSEQMPTSYRYVTEESAFNFREFFRTWTGDIERDFYPIPAGQKVGDFVHKDDVNNFLDLISTDSEDSNYPFSTDEYRDMFAHTFWIVPGVKEARALSALLKEHDKFKEFEIVNIAGDGDEEKPYDEALALVKNSIKYYDKTITISCGKLTTGVTVREWTGVMMLSGSSSTAAAGYMQAIFRVQSPGCINGKQKKNCYVFDFAPDRTLKVIAEVHSITHRGPKNEGARQALGEFINFCPIISVDGTLMRTYDVNDMMRQIKRISVEAAINSGFDDDTIYVADAGINMTDIDAKILQKLSDVVVPQKKGKKQTEVVVTAVGMTDEQRKLAKKAERKPKKDLTPEEKEALELRKKEKEEQKKMFNLLRAVSIRLPLLFYGADADITEIIHLKDFVKLVDEESWSEFMPRGLKPSLFLDILKYYDEDVVVGAGLRIRKMAKAADELPPTYRAKRIVEIISKFKNPDKETVLTPWRVVNMHMGDTLGGYNFYDAEFRTELEEPRLVDNGDITADILLNPEVNILELNSKSGLYPLYMAYSLYMIKVSGKEKDIPFNEAQRLWNETLEKNIFVLCKTKMAKTITIRTLAGYSGAKVNAIYLTKLVEERMKDIPRLTNKLTNPATWGIGGDRMKFDAVVGNPPYQENISSANDNASLSKQLYPLFMKSAVSISSRYTSLVTPSRWFTAEAQDKSFLRLREFIADNNHFKAIYNYPNNKLLFENVEIAGGVNYFLFDKEYSGDVEFYECSNTSKYPIHRPLFEDGLDVVIALNSSVRILNKIKAFGEFQGLSELATGRNAFGIVGKESELEKVTSTEPQNGFVKIFCAYEKVRYIEEEKVQKNVEIFNSWKIFTSKANGGAGLLGDNKPVSIIGKAYVAGPKVCCTDSLIPIGCFNTEQEAINLQKYMKTKFLRYLAGILKTSQNLYQGIYAFVPVQNFTSSSDINWEEPISEIDAQLYKKYSFTNEEIDFIENSIKPMPDEESDVNL